MKKLLLAAVASIALSTGAFAQITNTFSGNGNTGFGGVVGNSSLEIVSLADGTLNFTWTKGTGDFNDALVIYIDSVAGGFGDTLSFNDQADALRRAISGASEGTTGLDANSRSILTFNTGFTANYAFAANIGNPSGFGGLWTLASGGNDSLIFNTATSFAPNNNFSAATYTWSFNVSAIGLTANSGESFKFVGTYLNANNSFRANEAIGFDIAGLNPGNGGIGNYPNTIATSEFTFQTIPEPSTYALLGLTAAALGAHVIRRRRR
jgi:hypothetical protein